MKPPVEGITIQDPGAGDLPFPQRVRELEGEIRELKSRIVTAIAIFREALKEWSGQWMRENAKRIAIAQNGRTLALGRSEIARLKRDIDAHIHALESPINDEFTADRYGDAPNASSGQVNTVMERRFEAGLRKVLATLGPILERAGYVRNEHFVEAEPAETSRTRYPQTLELPPDLRDLISKVADAITDVKVTEAKIGFLDKQREKQLAAELWENA